MNPMTASPRNSEQRGAVPFPARPSRACGCASPSRSTGTKTVRPRRTASTAAFRSDAKARPTGIPEEELAKTPSASTRGAKLPPSSSSAPGGSGTSAPEASLSAAAALFRVRGSPTTNTAEFRTEEDAFPPIHGEEGAAPAAAVPLLASLDTGVAFNPKYKTSVASTCLHKTATTNARRRQSRLLPSKA